MHCHAAVTLVLDAKLTCQIVDSHLFQYRRDVIAQTVSFR